MSTKGQIIDEITKDKAYYEFCKKLCSGKDIFKDLYQHCILSLLEKKDEEIVSIYERGAIRPYFSRVIWLNINSPSSQFYRTNIAGEWEEIKNDVPQDGGDFDKEFNEFANRFDEAIERECNRCISEGFYPASIKLYQMYEEIGSLREISKCTMIPYNTVKRHVSETRKMILKKIDADISSNAK